jgi:hypothetical protein
MKKCEKVTGKNFRGPPRRDEAMHFKFHEKKLTEKSDRKILLSSTTPRRNTEISISTLQPQNLTILKKFITHFHIEKSPPRRNDSPPRYGH